MTPSDNTERLRLMAGLGHDLRAPLATIAGHASLLRVVVPGTHAPYLRAIERSVAQQLALIDELLEYTTGELQSFELQPNAVQFSEFIDEMAQGAFALGQKNGNMFEVVCGHAMPGLVMLDERRLRRVLLNLLANAAEHTVGGRFELEIRCQREVKGWRVAFRVADTGTGMTLDEQQRLFAAPTSDDTAQGRHGWGIPIARRIVESMGGRLHVISKPAKGSELSFTLMLDPAPPDENGTPSHGCALPDADRAALARLAERGQWSDIAELLDQLIADDPGHARAAGPVRAALDALDFKAITALARPFLNGANRA